MTTPGIRHDHRAARRAVVSVGHARRVRSVSVALRDILAAVIAGDADAVEHLVRAHLLSSANLLLDGLDPIDGT